LQHQNHITSAVYWVIKLYTLSYSKLLSAPVGWQKLLLASAGWYTKLTSSESSQFIPKALDLFAKGICSRFSRNRYTTPSFAVQELSRFPLVGYEWDTSRLDELRLRRFSEAYTETHDLMMHQHSQIKMSTIVPSFLFSTRYTNKILP
jgi:hypothetical protein